MWNIWKSRIRILRWYFVQFVVLYLSNHRSSLQIRLQKTNSLTELKICVIVTRHHLPVAGHSVAEGGPGVLVLHSVRKLSYEGTPWGGGGVGAGRGGKQPEVKGQVSLSGRPQHPVLQVCISVQWVLFLYNGVHFCKPLYSSLHFCTVVYISLQWCTFLYSGTS